MNRLFSYATLFSFAAASCHTITVINDRKLLSDKTLGVDRVAWSTSSIFGLYPLSEPVDLEAICGEDNWQSTSSSETIGNVFANFAAIEGLWVLNTLYVAQTGTIGSATIMSGLSADGAILAVNPLLNLSKITSHCQIGAPHKS